ncbi:MAG TPA: helical backbone metal receptor, partial [Tepidiformaceae bacterium]|nr:helical backbone metal receptor [Tepidiformaceae bacterium]
MPPARIVSLVPSLTELVWWLGAGERLVGRTRFCTEPAGLVEAVPIMGGTKNPHVERIVSARPDLVVANKEENRREDVEALQQAGLHVLLTDPNTVEEALA